ncbi:MAG: glutathione S-transferase [Aeromonadaceae bacterium]|nr:glutathione S-transferase [Aeromonadaceae bacterium]
MKLPCLVIGNCNYSSWSLRPFMALRHAGIEFELKKLWLDTPEFHPQVAALGGGRTVPLLVLPQQTLWESLAICEYAADVNPALWPADPLVRAQARSLACEMHAGFTALRSELPMNIRARRRVSLSAAAQADLARLFTLWQSCREAHGSAGPWLFGSYSVADAMFMPVASRLATYGIDCPPVAAAYRDTLLGDPHFADWQAMALAETQVVAMDEAGEPV